MLGTIPITERGPRLVEVQPWGT